MRERKQTVIDPDLPRRIIAQRLGPYEIGLPLKDGGMATLFHATRKGVAGFEKRFVMKRVHPRLASDERFRAMFIREARIAALIDHPHVVQVVDFGEDDDALFLIMEFVDGCSLRTLMNALAKQRRRLSPQLAVRVAIAIAEGLHAAHEATTPDGQSLSVVHRDVSPDNIMISRRGDVKLIDFGIAKSTDSTSETGEGTVKGKFAYMAPEQASAGEVDRRTDVYALGIVLWEMLTMKRCFRAETDLETLARVLKPEVVTPQRVVPEVPTALAEVVMRALRPSPAERPATTRVLRKMLVTAMPSAALVDAEDLASLLRVTGAVPGVVGSLETIKLDISDVEVLSDASESTQLLPVGFAEPPSPLTPRLFAAPAQSSRASAFPWWVLGWGATLAFGAGMALAYALV